MVKPHELNSRIEITDDVLNEELENLVQRIDDVGKRPDYKCGGSYDDKIEYERLLSVFCDLCLRAFREGRRFNDGAEG